MATAQLEVNQYRHAIDFEKSALRNGSASEICKDRLRNIYGAEIAEAIFETVVSELEAEKPNSEIRTASESAKPEGASEEIPQTIAEARETSESFTDEEIIETAVKHFREKWNHTDVVQKLLDEFYIVIDESTRKEVEELTRNAYDRFFEEREKEKEDLRKTAQEATDKRLEAEREANKQLVEKFQIAGKLDKTIDPNDTERAAKIIRAQEHEQKSKPKESSRRLEFVRGDFIRPKRLRWLWHGRILADKLNVFSGEPDVGKGMTTVDLAARITRQCDFPDCKNELDGPKDVVFLSSEDDMEDTIAPRLIVAGADMTRIHFARISENTSGTIEEGIVCLDRDLPALEEIIKRYPDTVLIIPDPVIAFLGDADPNKDKDVRPIYSKMKTFAKKLNVGWLFVNHWNKNQSATSINRTSGAKTMVSAPRATWMFTKSPEDPTRYLMMKGKGNLSSNNVKTLAYRIVGAPFDFGDGRGVEPNAVPKLIWDGETEHKAEQVLQDANDPKLRRNTKAEEFLTEFLQDGAKLASDIYRAADKQSLSVDKMKRARYSLDYLAERIANQWYWGKSQDDLTAVKTRIFSKAASVTFAAVGRV